MFSFGFKFLYFFRQQSLFMDEKGNSTVVVGMGALMGRAEKVSKVTNKISVILTEL